MCACGLYPIGTIICLGDSHDVHYGGACIMHDGSSVVDMDPRADAGSLLRDLRAYLSSRKDLESSALKERIDKILKREARRK